MSSKPRVGVIGSMEGALAGDVALDLVVTPYDGSLSGLDGVLVDGATASAAAQADSGVLQSVLQSGKLLALADPSAQALEALCQLTGGAPSEPPTLLTVRRNADGPGYASTVVAPGEVGSSVASEDGFQAAPTRRIPPAPLGPALVDALQAPSAADNSGVTINAAPVGTDGQPVTGALWGVFGPVTLNPRSTMELFGPVLYSAKYSQEEPDDKTAKKEMNEGDPLQKSGWIGGQSTFYVYYVNGDKSHPYYIVILHQKVVGFGPGTPALANNNNSRGWFALQMCVSANAPMQGNGQAFPEGKVTLLGHTPGTSADPVSYSMTVNMDLMVTKSGGRNPEICKVTVQGAHPFPDWGAIDQSATVPSPGTKQDFHQITSWNPVQDPPSKFPIWWKSVYPGHVISMPQASWDSITTYETYTAWSFPPVPPSSPKFAVQLSGFYAPTLAYLHNDDGCVGVQGHHHHLFCSTYGWYWPETLHLDTIVNQNQS